MAKIIVGIYDDRDQAEQVIHELTDSGFAVEEVRLSPEERGDAPLEEGQDAGSGIIDAVFGADDAERHKDVHEAVLRIGRYLVTVHAADNEQCERANRIMNRFHPLGIDERSTEWEMRHREDASGAARP